MFLENKTKISTYSLSIKQILQITIFLHRKFYSFQLFLFKPINSSVLKVICKIKKSLQLLRNRLTESKIEQTGNSLQSVQTCGNGRIWELVFKLLKPRGLTSNYLEFTCNTPGTESTEVAEALLLLQGLLGQPAAWNSLKCSSLPSF